TTVTVAVPLSATGTDPITAGQNQSFNGVLASFSGPSQNAGDYIARIEWGAGVVSVGTSCGGGCVGYNGQMSASRATESKAFDTTVSPTQRPITSPSHVPSPHTPRTVPTHTLPTCSLTSDTTMPYAHIPMYTSVPHIRISQRHHLSGLWRLKSRPYQRWRGRLH